jgi:hypothetical protein
MANPFEVHGGLILAIIALILALLGVMDLFTVGGPMILQESLTIVRQL